MFDVAEMHRSAFASEYAVSFALIFVVAYKRTYHAERVVFKKHITRLVDLSAEERADDFRDRRAYRAALAALRILAVETAPCLVDDVECHLKLPLSVNGVTGFFRRALQRIFSANNRNSF